MRLFKPDNNIPGLTLFPPKFATNPKLGAGAKVVYLSHASRAQEDRPAPSEQEVADEMSMTIDEVREAIRELDAIPDAEWDAMQS